MTMTFVNLTPHDLNVHQDGEVTTFPKSGEVARVATTSEPRETEWGMSYVVTVYGDVEGLPDPKEGTVFLVSGMVEAQVPHRPDVFSPGPLVRDENGRPVGCNGFKKSA